MRALARVQLPTAHGLFPAPNQAHWRPEVAPSHGENAGAHMMSDQHHAIANLRFVTAFAAWLTIASIVIMIGTRELRYYLVWGTATPSAAGIIALQGLTGLQTTLSALLIICVYRYYCCDFRNEQVGPMRRFASDAG